MSDEKQTMKLLERGYFTLPMCDEGLELELVESIDVEIERADIEKVMDKPEVLFKPFKDKKAGWAEFTAIYFMLPDLILKAVKGMKEEYDYIIPIIVSLGIEEEDYSVRVSFDCFNKLS